MPPGVLFFENLYLWERAVMEPISGRRQDTPVDWFFRCFVEVPAGRVLSLSCGTGFWERRISEMGFADRIDAFDLSPACLEWARELASGRRLDNISYFPADINTVRLEPDLYDCAISVAALHHVSNLEHVFAEVAGALKPGGLFFFDEYIGPNRMQWTDRVLEETNRLLAGFPRRYRRMVSGGVKTAEERVPVEKMIETDPSEAVRSKEIIGLAGEYFDIAEKREYGGAILMPLFMNIIGNFDAGRAEDREILDRCLERERSLLAAGEIPANGAVVVCRKKSRDGE